MAGDEHRRATGRQGGAHMLCAFNRHAAFRFARDFGHMRKLANHAAQLRPAFIEGFLLFLCTQMRHGLRQIVGGDMAFASDFAKQPPQLGTQIRADAQAGQPIHRQEDFGYLGLQKINRVHHASSQAPCDGAPNCV